MSRLRHKRGKIPEIIVGGSSLGHLIIRFGLKSVDQIGKLDPIMYKKHRDIIAHQVVISFLSIKFCSKAPTIPYCVGRSSKAHHLGETDKYGRFCTRIGE